MRTILRSPTRERNLWTVIHGLPMRTRVWLLIAAFPLNSCGWGAKPPPREWVEVARDTNYRILVDSSRLVWQPAAAAYIVWYRTDHAAPRLKDGQPFNREVVGSLLSCERGRYKVTSVDLSLNGARPISRQRTEFRDQEWRHVVEGTIEEAAARNACVIARAVASR